MFLTIVVFFLILGVIVLVHEAGHYFTAIKNGIKVDEFGLGLPPRAIGFYKDDNGKWVRVGRKAHEAQKTIWSLNWVPLGGFVKIKGEEGEDINDPDSFAQKSILARGVVLSAGVFMNIVFAMVMLTILFILGTPQILDDRELPPSARISNEHIRILNVLEESPAARAGIEVADIVKKVDGETFGEIGDVQAYMDERIGEEVRLTIERKKELIEVDVVPEILTQTERGGIGVALVEMGQVSYPWYTAWFYGIKETFILIGGIFAGFYLVIKNLIVSQQLVGEVYGPVGIATLVGDSIDLGYLYVLQFTAVLSTIIAVINYLPFPALDGGRVLFLIIEAIRRKPVDQKFEATMHNIGFALLMILVVIVTYRDIARISGGLLTKITGLF